MNTNDFADLDAVVATTVATLDRTIALVDSLKPNAFIVDVRDPGHRNTWVFTDRADAQRCFDFAQRATLRAVTLDNVFDRRSISRVFSTDKK